MMARRITPIRIIIRLMLAGTICGNVLACSIYADHVTNRPANVMAMETRLVQAGFRRVPIETPEQNGAVAQLPMHRLNRYESASGNVYWYADPTVCSCLYEGDQRAYETYAGQLQQEHDLAQYVNDVQPEQVAYLSPFGYAFPPPLLLGGWPVLVPGGPIHPVGPPHGGPPVQPHPGGGGVTSHPGHGGGITSHGHGGGGHSIGGHGGGHH